MWRYSKKVFINLHSKDGFNDLYSSKKKVKSFKCK